MQSFQKLKEDYTRKERELSHMQTAQRSGAEELARSQDRVKALELQLSLTSQDLAVWGEWAHFYTKSS